MSSISDSIQLTLEEKIVPTIFESLWELDPIYPMIARSYANVVRNQGIGRNWTILKTHVTGMSGGAKFTSVAGGNVISGPKNFNVYDTPNAFQAIDETTAPAFVQTSVSLIEHRGNFYLPHQIMRADQLNSSIGSVVAQNLKGVADILAQQEAATFYSTNTSTYQLADIGVTATNVSDTSGDGSAMDFDVSGASASGRIHRFRQGMLVDIYNSAGTVKRNVGFTLGIDNVDPLAKTVTIRATDGSTFQVATSLNGGVTYAGAGGDNDIIVIKDSIGVAPNGIESFIADGTTLTSWFGIAVANYGQFKSYLPLPISGPLTDTVLNRHCAMFFESFPGRKMDCMLTTMGALIGYIDNLDTGAQGGLTAQDGRMRYDRNGKALEIEAGWESFKYRFASRAMEIYTSTYVEPGVLYAGKIKNGGITRYVPPPIPGSKQDARFGAEVEFVAPIGGSGGYQGIFKHAHNSTGATTDFIEAPFVRQWNCMPTQPNWMKLSGITEIIG